MRRTQLNKGFAIGALVLVTSGAAGGHSIFDDNTPSEEKLRQVCENTPQCDPENPDDLEAIQEEGFVDHGTSDGDPVDGNPDAEEVLGPDGAQ